MEIWFPPYEHPRLTFCSWKLLFNRSEAILRGIIYTSGICLSSAKSLYVNSEYNRRRIPIAWHHRRWRHASIGHRRLLLGSFRPNSGLFTVVICSKSPWSFKRCTLHCMGWRGECIEEASIVFDFSWRESRYINSFVHYFSLEAIQYINHLERKFREYSQNLRPSMLQDCTLCAETP